MPGSWLLSMQWPLYSSSGLAHPVLFEACGGTGLSVLFWHSRAFDSRSHKEFSGAQRFGASQGFSHYVMMPGSVNTE